MKKSKFETLAIETTQNIFENSKPVSVPIYLSSTYKMDVDGSYTNDFVYSRNDNPNRKILEKSLAALENGNYAIAFSSGMGAISAVFQSLKTGDHVLLPNDIYFTIRKLLDQVFTRWGLTFDYVDMTNVENVKNAIKQNTSLIWVETPSNPQLKITDIKEIANLAHQNHALCAVDNTWLTPVFQNPFEFGADIVVHSTTKYIGGHSDVVGGCIIVNDLKISEKIREIQLLMGAVPSPFDCWLLTRGIQTLHLRISKQNENATALARFLTNHSKIVKVLYPGLENHPQYKVAKKQQKGVGAMLSVLIKGSEGETISIENKLKHFTKATSLGGVESLIEHRKSVEGPLSTTPPNLLRISVGIENIDDLIDDWKQALS